MSVIISAIVPMILKFVVREENVLRETTVAVIFVSMVMIANC